MNQRILNSVAKQGSTDLNGPRGTQHALCASGPLLVLSRFADLLVSAKLGLTPPPSYTLSIVLNMAASVFVGVLPLNPPALCLLRRLALRAISVALGSARCLLCLLSIFFVAA